MRGREARAADSKRWAASASGLVPIRGPRLCGCCHWLHPVFSCFGCGASLTKILERQPLRHVARAVTNGDMRMNLRISRSAPCFDG